MTDNTDTATATEPTESDAENITQLGLSQIFEGQTDEAESTEEESLTEETPETEDEEVLSQLEEEETESEGEEEQVPKSVQKLVKQVGKLTARAKDAEERLEALQQQKMASGNEGTQILSDIHTPDDLEKYKETAMRARKFAMANIGKDYVEHNGEEFDSEKISSLLEEADEALTKHIPEREKHIYQKAQIQQSMPAHFDWLNNEEHKVNEFFHIARGMPEIKKIHTLPQGDFLFGLLAEGWNAIQSKANAMKKAPAQGKAKPKPPSNVSNNSAPPTQTRKKSDILGNGNVDFKTFSKFLETEKE
jgi:hypothetical protein